MVKICLSTHHSWTLITSTEALLRKKKFIERGSWLPRIGVNTEIQHRQTEGDFFSDMLYKTVAMPRIVMQDCNPQYLGGRDRRTRVQGQPVLHSEFQARVNYTVRSYLERKKEKWKKGSLFFSVSLCLFLPPSWLNRTINYVFPHWLMSAALKRANVRAHDL